jgi:hypothetical protein
MSVETVLVPKWEGEWDNEEGTTTPKPCWLPIQDIKGNPMKPVVVCNCGKRTQINKHHVHASGLVTASYYHPKDLGGCGYHVYITLQDWIGLEFLPGENYPKGFKKNA